jgi:hypothetical protein
MRRSSEEVSRAGFSGIWPTAASGWRSPWPKTGILPVTERSRQHGKRQQVEISLASLEREFRLGETLATTLLGLATGIATKVTAYASGFSLNRLLGRPQGRIKESWA